MQHDHPAHDTHHPVDVTLNNERRVRMVLIVTASYALIQVIGGWYSGSLALIADSGHMLSDAAALLLAIIAYRLARRPADATRTYGFHRVRVLAALANGAILLLLVFWIILEAIKRINQPIEILAGPMLFIAIVGLGVNIFGAYMLWSGHKDDSNLRGAFLHVVGDLLGSVGAIAAAIGIMLTNWSLLDPILSILVAALIIRSVWGLLVDSIRVLLQAAPRELDTVVIENALINIEGVAEAGHFHAWTLTDKVVIATVHVSPEAGVDPLDLPSRVAQWLKQHYAIEHVTVQVDPPQQLNSHA